MAGSVNKVILIGHLGHEPSITRFSDGGKVVKFSLATSEAWKDKATGERKEKTQWHNIVINNDGLAGIAEKYLHKGSKVYIEGQLETRKYTGRDNVEKYTTEVVLRPYRGELTLLDGRKGENPYNTADQAEPEYAGDGAPTQETQPPKTDIDDDIPF